MLASSRKNSAQAASTARTEDVNPTSKVRITV